MKALVIEDEVPAQEELIRIVNKRLPYIDIAGVARSVRDSVEWLGKNSADLIFMDIQLSDGCCFDIFKITDVRTPVIFTTAFDQYALNAFKVNSVDYLLKPIDEEELVSAVKKLDYRYSRIAGLMEDFISIPGKYKTRISVRCGDSYSFLTIDKVAYFISENGLTFAVSFSGQKHMVDYTIESLEPLLDPEMFFRATRGCIISIASIDKVSRYFNSRLQITLKGSSISLIVSRVRVQDFLGWLDGR